MKQKNPLKSEGAITINGAEYKLEFDMPSLSDAEEESGLTLICGMTEKQLRQPSIKLAWAMFYGMAKKHTPSLTWKQVKSLVLPGNFKDVWEESFLVYLSGWPQETPKNE